MVVANAQAPGCHNTLLGSGRSLSIRFLLGAARIAAAVSAAAFSTVALREFEEN